MRPCAQISFHTAHVNKLQHVLFCSIGNCTSIESRTNGNGMISTQPTAYVLTFVAESNDFQVKAVNFIVKIMILAVRLLLRSPRMYFSVVECCQQTEHAGNSTKSMTGRGWMCEFLLTLSLSLSRNVATSSCPKRKQTSFFQALSYPCGVCTKETTLVRINRFRLSLNCRVSRQK